jgi:hypothetical protein
MVSAKIVECYALCSHNGRVLGAQGFMQSSHSGKGKELCKYMHVGILVPEATSPCRPGAGRSVQDQQASRVHKQHVLMRRSGEILNLPKIADITPSAPT